VSSHSTEPTQGLTTNSPNVQSSATDDPESSNEPDRIEAKLEDAKAKTEDKKKKHTFGNLLKLRSIWNGFVEKAEDVVEAVLTTGDNLFETVVDDIKEHKNPMAILDEVVEEAVEAADEIFENIANKVCIIQGGFSVTSWKLIKSSLTEMGLVGGIRVC